MHCILVGITPRSTKSEDAIWNAVSHGVLNVDGNAVNWITYSEARDEGKPTQLLCATSNASVDDVVAATSEAVVNLSVSCELWASAPAILPLRPLYDGYDKHIVKRKYLPDNSWEDWATLTLKEWGIVVQTSLVDRREAEKLRICINQEIESIEKLIHVHSPGINIGMDIMSFQEIASRGNERFDLLLPPASEANDIVECVVLKRMTSLIEKVLDGHVKADVDFDISVVYSKPGAPNQGWHADGDHQKGASDAGWAVDGWKTRLAEPYALCLFIPLVDLDDETGFTQFWPGSHRNRGLMGFGPVAEISEATWDGKCKAGDAIWYDYRLMHRGMGNTSKLLRPVLQVLFKKSWYAETRNYGTDSLRC